MSEKPGAVKEGFPAPLTPQTMTDHIYASRKLSNLFIVMLIALAAMPLVGIGVFATHRMTDPAQRAALLPAQSSQSN